MKQLYLILLVILPVFPLGAQVEPFHMVPDSPSVIARVSLVAAKFVVELAPADNFTFSTGLWIRPRFWSEDDSGDREFHPYPSLNPRVTFEPRYFFGLEHRMERGKRTDYYSGWYVGIPFAIEFPDLEYSMGTAMGFQCSFGRHWYWNVSTGPGISLKQSRFRMDWIVDVGFGIILN